MKRDHTSVLYVSNNKETIDHLNQIGVCQTYMKLLLFCEYASFTRDQIMKNIQNVFDDKEHKTIEQSVKDKIKSIMSNKDLDIEQVYFNIKNCGIIDDFSDEIIICVDDLTNNVDDESDLRNEIYAMVAKCFIPPAHHYTNLDLYNDALISWKCNN